MTEVGDTRNLRRQCGVCQTPVRPDAAYCVSCGAKAPEGAPAVQAAVSGGSHARKRKRSLGGLFIGISLLLAGGWVACDALRSNAFSERPKEHPTEIVAMSSEADPVQEFVSEYYEASGVQVWSETHSLLDDEAKSQITEEDWRLAQSLRYTQNLTPPVASAEVVNRETDGQSIVADLLITYEDGGREEVSGFTMSIDPESGEVKRSLTDEDLAYLRNLVNANRACQSSSPSEIQYGINCEDATSIVVPGNVDVAEDAMRDATTAIGAINPEEPTTETTVVEEDFVIGENVEDAMRDSTTAAGALASSPGDEETPTEGTPVEDMFFEETSAEDTPTGESFAEASAEAVRFERMKAVGGGAAMLFGAMLVGWSLWPPRV